MGIKIEYDNNVLTADAGIVDVCYVEQRQEIRVVRKRDRQVLRVDPFPEFNLSDFIEIVKKFDKICNQK